MEPARSSLPGPWSAKQQRRGESPPLPPVAGAGPVDAAENPPLTLAVVLGLEVWRPAGLIWWARTSPAPPSRP